MSNARENFKALMPKTTLGKWSVGLMLAFFVFLVVFIILAATGQRGGDSFFSNLALTVPALLAGASAILSLVIGLVGIFKSKERSFFAFLVIAIGFIVLVFLIGEFSFPH